MHFFDDSKMRVIKVRTRRTKETYNVKLAELAIHARLDLGNCWRVDRKNTNFGRRFLLF